MLRDNIAKIRREPSLLAVEVAWRWTFGAVAIVLLAFAFVRLQHAMVINPEEEAQLQSMSPELVGQTLVLIAYRALPIAARLAAFIIPALLILWTVAVSVGRAIVLTRLIGVEPARLNWSGFVAVHGLRALSVVALVGGYFAASLGASLLVNPDDPNYLMSALIFILLFIVVVAIWMWVHWVLSIAAIYPAKERAGAVQALRSAVNLVRSRGGELAGIATANGTARTAVALVFTFFGLLPLPLYRVAPGVLAAMEVVIALAYCVVSDWFLLARLIGYLEVATSPAGGTSSTGSPR